MDAERADLLESLDKHRGLLRRTVRRLDDADAVRRTTVSELSLGGIIKHVAATEERWVAFIEKGPDAFDPVGPETAAQLASTFALAEGDTLVGVLERYAVVAQRTDDLVRSVPSLDASHPLPEAPWFPPGARWSVRRVLLHLIGETAQHAGHADIIREALDGKKTMG